MLFRNANTAVPGVTNKNATLAVAFLFGGAAAGICLSRPRANKRVLIPTGYAKQKATQRGGIFVWWRRRESNPRPQALYRQYYMLSQVI
jgi:hypothetical protein